MKTITLKTTPIQKKRGHSAEFEGQIPDKEVHELLLQKSAIGPGVGCGGRLRRRSRRAPRARVVVDLAGVRSASRAELATHSPMNERSATVIRSPPVGNPKPIRIAVESYRLRR